MRKNIKKNQIGTKIEKSLKSGIITSKRIYTQPILDFEKNGFLSNISGIKNKKSFFGNYNKIFLTN